MHFPLSGKCMHQLLRKSKSCSFSRVDDEKQCEHFLNSINCKIFRCAWFTSQTVLVLFPLYGHDLIWWSSITIVSFQEHMFSLTVSEQSGLSVMRSLGLGLLAHILVYHDVSFQCVKLMGIQEQVKRLENLYHIRGMCRYCIYRYTPGNSLPYPPRVTFKYKPLSIYV